MSIYWMSWVGIASACFAGCLAALFVAWCIRFVRVVLGAASDGNRNQAHAIDTHARGKGHPGHDPKTGIHAERRPQPVEKTVDKSVEATQAMAPHTFAEQKPDPATVLVGPPMVGAYSLRDYLIHYSGDDQVWGKLVPAFYGRAAKDAVVFAVFQKVARDKGMDVGELVEEVQRHFLAMLIVMTHVGLSVRLRDSLQHSHAFAAISADAYDRTVTALVQTLTEYGTPQEAFPPLVEMVTVLQPYIVTV